MRITTTDGREFYVPDMCIYCSLDTVGNHRWDCPCNPHRYKKSIKIKYEFQKGTYNPCPSRKGEL